MLGNSVDGMKSENGRPTLPLSSLWISSTASIQQHGGVSIFDVPGRGYGDNPDIRPKLPLYTATHHVGSFTGQYNNVPQVWLLIHILLLFLVIPLNLSMIQKHSRRYSGPIDYNTLLLTQPFDYSPQSVFP